MEERVIKKIGNGNFYILGFITSLILMFGFALIVQLISIYFFEAREPGFSQLYEAASQYYVIHGSFELYTDSMYAVENFTQLFGTLLVAIVLIIFLNKTLIKDFIEFKKNIWYNFLSIVLGFVVIYVVSIGMALLYDLLGIQGTSGNQSAIEDALHSPTGYLMLLSVIFLAPLVEELLFRKLCFGALQVKLHCPKILAVLISAILFAAMHGIDIFYFQYLAMALVISGSYAIFKNNIYIPMGIHFLNNLSVLFVLVVMV